MLKNGQVFKNYKELCGFMGWEIKSGNAKIAQFKELDRICKCPLRFLRLSWHGRYQC